MSDPNCGKWFYVLDFSQLVMVVSVGGFRLGGRFNVMKENVAL